MSKRKNDLFGEAIVGLFMVVVIALLAYFTIVISGVDILSGKEKSRVTIRFQQVGGLKVHDAVMYRGTKVGGVTAIYVSPSNLVVTADVDQNVTLRQTARATVCNLSMLGGNYLLLEEGEGEPIDKARTQLVGDDPTDWLRDVTEISRNLRVITDMAELKNIVTNINLVSEKAVAFADRANEVAEKAGVFADDANAMIARIRRGEGTVGRVIADDGQIYDDFKSAVADARAVAAKINRDKMFDDLEAGVAAFRASAESFNAKDMMNKANDLLDKLTAVAEGIRSGKGTLGRLANDSALYDEVNGLIRDCRQIIDNYRDTTPITTFSSLATGAL